MIRCCVENYKVEEFENRICSAIFEERHKFCGYSLYQPQPPRNPKLAPKRFLHGAQGLFLELVAYCHYCVRGLKLGGKTAFHLAQLLFET